VIFSFENIYRQYLLCRRNKRNTLNALRFEAHQEKNLLDLKEALETRTYQPSRSVCFVATRPKLREIFAADFKDRIVHHILIDYLEGIWEPIFIHDSYACRKGKGVHRGVLRLQEFIRKVTANGNHPAFYIQLDIKNYFMSIDKEILFSLIAGKVRDETALWLTRVLIFHDCTDHYVFRGDTGLLKNIPPHKTLFHTPRDKGLPIGNLNSQFFANVYLNGLDQFVKHHLKCRYYLRYCDDFVLLSRDREELLRWRHQIEGYLGEKLRLELNHKRQRLQPVTNGVDFLGYIVRRDYLLVRRRVVNNLRAKLSRYEGLLVKEGRHSRRYRFDEEILDRLAATLSSYLGHFKMANTYSLCRSLWDRYPFLSQYLDLEPQARKLVRKYRHPRGMRSVYSQYLYYHWRFRGDILFFQVGRFFEFYHAKDKGLAYLLGLSRMQKNPRGAKYGFPVNLMNRYFWQLLKRRVSVTVILERERYLTGIKERAPLYRFEFLAC
jgi:retron-type reverse transcriptase